MIATVLQSKWVYTFNLVIYGIPVVILAYYVDNYNHNVDNVGVSLNLLFLVLHIIILFSNIYALFYLCVYNFNRKLRHHGT